VLRPVRVLGEHAGAFWAVALLTGNLLRYASTPRAAVFDRRPALVTEALSFVERPFSCRSPWPAPAVDVDDDTRRRLEAMHARLLSIGNRRFFWSVAYAGLARPLFDTTRQAMAAVAALPRQRAERTSLCLQRSLLVAKVSRSFAARGVVFVGANVETGDMHAWIIEDGEQPDADDRTWINYRPLLALVGPGR
jgi:hypothetical protein